MGVSVPVFHSDAKGGNWTSNTEDSVLRCDLSGWSGCLWKMVCSKKKLYSFKEACSVLRIAARVKEIFP